MKRIKLTLICTTALMLAIPLAGCTHGDSGNATVTDIKQKIEALTEENENCPNGECPDGDSKNGECPDGKCDKKTDKLPENRDGECPNGKRPVRLLPPHARHDNRRIAPMPRPSKSF